MFNYLAFLNRSLVTNDLKKINDRFKLKEYINFKNNITNYHKRFDSN